MVEKLSQWFETRKRDNGESFVTLKDGHPEWLKSAVYEAHRGQLPDDWIYAVCARVCEKIDDQGFCADAWSHEFCDSEVDIYTKERFKWAHEQCLTTLFSEAEERAAELSSGCKDANEWLGVVQFCAIEIIVGCIVSAVREQENDGSEGEDESEDDGEEASP